jgi:hypothetical protein
LKKRTRKLLVYQVSAVCIGRFSQKQKFFVSFFQKRNAYLLRHGEAPIGATVAGRTRRTLFPSNRNCIAAAFRTLPKWPAPEAVSHDEQNPRSGRTRIMDLGKVF